MGVGFVGAALLGDGMCFDYYRRASYISGKSFVVGMAIWALLLAGMLLIDLTATFATKSDNVILSTYSYDTYDVAVEGEE